MTPYFIVLAIVMLLVSLEERIGNKARLLRYLVIALMLGILTFFAGLRNMTVGTDTGNYVWDYLFDPYYGLFYFRSGHEPGFQVLRNISKYISPEYWVYLSIIAFLAVSLSLKSLRTLSVNYRLSLFLYIVLGGYVFFFNGARQGLAIAFFGIALIYLVRGSLKKYLFWVLVAFLFHKTAIIAAPLYFFIRSGFSWKKVLVSIGIFSLLFVVLINTINIEDTEFEKFGQYVDRGALGGGGFTFYNVAVFLILLLFRKYISPMYLKQYDIYLNLVLFGALIFFFVWFRQLDVNIMRLSFYFLIGHVLIWPIVFKSVDFQRLSSFVKFLFIGVHLFYFVMVLSQSRLTPYIMNLSLT